MAPIECALLLADEALMHSTFIFNVDRITKNLIIIPSIFHVCMQIHWCPESVLYIIIFRLLFYINTYFINRTIYVNLFFQIIKWSVRQEKWHSNSNYVGFPCSSHGRHFDIQTEIRNSVSGTMWRQRCASCWRWSNLCICLVNGVGMKCHHAFVQHKKGCFADFGHAVMRYCAAVLLFFFRFMSSPWVLRDFR